jgi:hypothetical protein
MKVYGGTQNKAPCLLDLNTRCMGVVRIMVPQKETSIIHQIREWVGPRVILNIAARNIPMALPGNKTLHVDALT